MSQDMETVNPTANSASPQTGGPSSIRVSQKSEGQPGGALRRFVASMIDGFVTSVVSYPVILILAAVLGAVGGAEMIVTVLSYILGWGVTIVYYGWFYSRKGASPGKMVLDLKVVQVESGTNLGFWQGGLLRHIIGSMACAFTLGIGWLIIPFRADKRGLHDFIAGSQVLHIKEK